MPLKVVRLQVSNFKKIKLADITPASNVIRITGANGEGKSSILDAIFAAVAGRRAQPQRPIREGAAQGTIQVDLGKYVVYRVFTEDDRQPPVIVRPRSGGVGGMAGRPIRSPQDLLDEMLGDLTFDPLEFSRMRPADQYEELRRVAQIGPEIDEFDRLNQTDYDERTRLNRAAKESLAAANDIDIPDDVPFDRVNVAVLAEAMEQAIRHNEGIERQKSENAANSDRIVNLRARAGEVSGESHLAIKSIQSRRDAKIVALRAEIDSVNAQADLDIREEREKSRRLSESILAELGRMQDALAALPPVPELMDVFGYKEQIANAEVINSCAERRDRREQKLAEARSLERAADALTAAILDRTQKKQSLIGSAKMPVAGLSLQDGQVFYGGVPFSQASSAEQLRVSVAIAMAQNPELRILRIKDGSLLDSKSMEILEQMAEDQDFQVWVESVDESGKIGIVMEDGSVAVDNYRQPDAIAGELLSSE